MRGRYLDFYRVPRRVSDFFQAKMASQWLILVSKIVGFTQDSIGKNAFF